MYRFLSSIFVEIICDLLYYKLQHVLAGCCPAVLVGPSCCRLSILQVEGFIKGLAAGWGGKLCRIIMLLCPC